LRRNADPGGTDQVATAQSLTRQRRVACRPRKKLLPDAELFELVAVLLRRYFFPEQLAGKLQHEYCKF
jgi:IS30 family transposase